MSYKPNWSNGEWLTICDACGRKFKDSALRMRWDGLMVCSGDWEVRQPQDYVRGVADIQAPPYVRPEQQDRFLPYFFTQYPTEEIDVSEKTTKGFTKVIGDRNIGDAGALNGSALNAYYLGYSDDGIDPEQILLSESVLVILGRSLSDTLSVSESTAKTITKTLSDTIVVAESLQLVEVEEYVESLSLSESVTTTMSFVKSISETVGVAETVSRLLVSASALNGSALNSSALD
jgi:hypothetical protein